VTVAGPPGDRHVEVTAGRTPGVSETTHGDCPRCGGALYERHCKLCCRNCGVVRDCSDPF
jgi:hypothetical protein